MRSECSKASGLAYKDYVHIYAIGRPREEWRQEVRFIILQVSVFCRCTSRDVTVFLLHLPLLKNDTMLLLKGCDHVHAIVQVADWKPFISLSAVALE